MVASGASGEAMGSGEALSSVEVEVEVDRCTSEGSVQVLDEEERDGRELAIQVNSLVERVRLGPG
jgi:hypothetical protein